MTAEKNPSLFEFFVVLEKTETSLNEAEENRVKSLLKQLEQQFERLKRRIKRHGLRYFKNILKSKRELLQPGMYVVVSSQNGVCLTFHGHGCVKFDFKLSLCFLFSSTSLTSDERSTIEFDDVSETENQPHQSDTGHHLTET